MKVYKMKIVRLISTLTLAIGLFVSGTNLVAHGSDSGESWTDL